MLSIIFLRCYFSSLLMFSFVSHPVFYCVLLVGRALSVSGYICRIVGFSWYLALFCLVYVGGVYVLFVFVSVYRFKVSPLVRRSFYEFVLFFLVLVGVFRFGLQGLPAFVEGRHYLCSFFEGFSYCLFCLIMMLGFVGVRIVVGEKDAFYR
jgi:NADH:ubiquinone oxidoreductase subunit 6 (subunit J)